MECDTFSSMWQKILKYVPKKQMFSLLNGEQYIWNKDCSKFLEIFASNKCEK